MRLDLSLDIFRVAFVDLKVSDISLMTHMLRNKFSNCYKKKFIPFFFENSFIKRKHPAKLTCQETCQNSTKCRHLQQV